MTAEPCETSRLTDQMIPNSRRRTEPGVTPVSAAMACAVGLCLLAQPAASAVGPRLAYEPDKIDFGVKPKGIQLSGIFIVKNTGDETLKVSGLEASCGCVTAGQDKFDLNPGDRAELTFTLDTQEYSDGSIKLKTNEPDRPHVMLPIHIIVLDDVQISDDRLSFGLVERGTSPAVSLTVWSTNAHKPARIRSLTSNIANVELWHESTIDKASRPGEVVYAKLKTANMPPGRFGGWVDLVLDLDKKPALKIEISGQVVSGIMLSPGWMLISADKRELRQDVKRAVIVTHSAEQKFRILRAESNDPNVKVSFDDSFSSDKHTVTVRLSKTIGKTRGRVRATVRLFTDTRKAPHSVKIYYTVK